jgi:hypothetical protein
VLRTILKKASRALVIGVCFWLPEQSKVRLERWLRGRSEYRELQRADVVVVAFGKSGRTWLRVMLSNVLQLSNGGSGAVLLSGSGSARQSGSVPRIFFTHDNYIQDFTGNRASKVDFRGRRVVLLVRDPRDVTVSQYFQWKYRMKRKKTRVNGYPRKGTEVSIYDFVMNPDYGIARCVDFLNRWAREIERMPDLLVVRYEDLRRQPIEHLSRVVAFLGLDASGEVVERAVDDASVENMRSREASNASLLAGGRMKPGDRDNADSYKVRRAKVGGYRDYFTDDEVTRIDAFVDERLLPAFGYTKTHPARDDAAASGCER